MSGKYLIDMADVLRHAGCNVIEQANWQTRSRSSGGYGSGYPLCVMWHHTASGANASAKADTDYMSYSADAKPIANIMVARNGDVWVLAAGATNTNGSGNARSFSRGTVPADGMNTRAIGVEIQNTGVGQEYSQACIDAMFKVSNALNKAYGNVPTDCDTHVGYAPGRKIDPATAAAVQGPWKPRSINSSGSWNLDDVRAECTRRAGSTPIPPTPTPTPEADMATAILHVVNCNAQFIGQGPLLANGTVHNLFITWYGPGAPTAPNNPFLSDHAAAPDVIHQDVTMDTIRRDLILLGNPEEIEDSAGPWGSGDFFRVIRS